MIRTPTVFVLGAGASAPYGYPLGDALTARIRELTNSNGGIWNALVAKFGAVGPVLSFHHALTKSEPRSIDDFLESNPQFLDIGKLSIAAALTVYGPPHQYPISSSLHWYRYLWQLMHAEAATSKEFRGNQVKVITYNYDTSFERYFRRCVAGMYTDIATDSTAERFVEDVLPVVHVHGSLGWL